MPEGSRPQHGGKWSNNGSCSKAMLNPTRCLRTEHFAANVQSFSGLANK